MSILLAFFPSPLPEELLYSVVARYHHLVGDRNVASIERLFGSRLISPTLPGHLDRLIEVTEGRLGSVNDVVDRYTTFPYYRQFLPARAVATAIAGMRRGNLVRVVITNGVPANHHFALRLCPLCVDAQTKRHAVAYWLRAHQLPGVRVCAEHETDLIDSCPTCGTFKTRSYAQSLLPLPSAHCGTCGIPLTATYRERDASPRGETTLRFARMSDALLRLTRERVPISLRNRVYMDRMRELGAPTRRKRDLLSWLGDRILATYSPDLVNQLGLAVGDQPRLPPLLLRDHQSSPAIHLCLIGVLFGSLEAYLQAVTARATKSAAQERLAVPQALAASGYDVEAAGTALGRTPEAMVDELLTNRLEIARQLGKDANRTTFITSAAASGVALSKLAVLTELSLDTVEKLFRRDPNAVARREETLFRIERAKRRALFETVRSSADSLHASLGHGYTVLAAWLRRNDAQWLAATLQRTPRRISRIEVVDQSRKRYRELFMAARSAPEGMQSRTYGGLGYSTILKWLRKHDSEWLSGARKKVDRHALRRARHEGSMEHIRSLFLKWRASAAGANEVAALGYTYHALYCRLRSYDSAWLAATLDQTQRGKPGVVQRLRDKRRAIFESLRASSSSLNGHAIDGHTYAQLYRWFRKHDPDWLAQVMRRTKRSTNGKPQE